MCFIVSEEDNAIVNGNISVVSIVHEKRVIISYHILSWIFIFYLNYIDWPNRGAAPQLSSIRIWGNQELTVAPVLQVRTRWHLVVIVWDGELQVGTAAWFILIPFQVLHVWHAIHLQKLLFESDTHEVCPRCSNDTQVISPHPSVGSDCVLRGCGHLPLHGFFQYGDKWTLQRNTVIFLKSHAQFVCMLLYILHAF